MNSWSECIHILDTPYLSAKIRHSCLSHELTPRVFAVLLLAQSSAWPGDWYLFNPKSHGICAQGILPARPACVIWFSRHTLNRHDCSEQSAPCNPALPRSSAISSLTLDRGFKTPSGLQGLRATCSMCQRYANQQSGYRWASLLYWCTTGQLLP